MSPASLINISPIWNTNHASVICVTFRRSEQTNCGGHYLEKYGDQGRSLYGERRLLGRHSKFSSWYDQTAYNGTFSNVLMRILVPNAATLTRLSLAVLNFIDGQELRRRTVGVSVEQTSFLPDFQFRLFDCTSYFSKVPSPSKSFL